MLENNHYDKIVHDMQMDAKTQSKIPFIGLFNLLTDDPTITRRLNLY